MIDRVANSTPMVDLDSRLNSLRVNRESTVYRRGVIGVEKDKRQMHEQRAMWDRQ
jgi:hypothetical protein